MRYSVVLPCRNEEKALALCIQKIREAMHAMHTADFEIIVSDSSTDGSPRIAKDLGVVLVKHDKVGYGRAYIEGIRKARGEILILGDADGTYDFHQIPQLVQFIDEYDLVLGRRSSIRSGAMPLLHRYLGNPALSFLMRCMFGVGVQDSHSGFRVLRKTTFDSLELRATGMEFASEMIIKAARKGLRIKEVPIDYLPRLGVSKLRSFSDGWKHLRFMLLYSPMFLFLLPGMVLFTLGVIAFGLLSWDVLQIGTILLYQHPLFVASLMILIGFQLVTFGLFAKMYAVTHLGERSELANAVISHITLERALCAGALIIAVGLGIGVDIFVKWVSSGFGALNEMKLGVIMLTLLFLGVQIVFSAFMLSILTIRELPLD